MTRTTIVRKATAIAAALVALTVAFVAGTGSAAVATDGQPITAGTQNTETTSTLIWNQVASCSTRNAPTTGVNACGAFGVAGYGSQAGLFGEGYGGGDGVQGLVDSAAASAVFANNTGGGKGVFGASTTGNGVEGGTDGATASGVYGSNSGSGYGVDGQSDSGIGVGAVSANGTALKVTGKAEFSRSGIVTITYPAKSVVITGVPLTATSLVLATQQKFLAGVYVVAAVPKLSGSSNSFTIYLSKAPGTSAAPKSVTVAWQVIERP